MFTGIIESVGKVLSSVGGAHGSTVLIDIGPCAQNLRVGGSVAVDGVCLTATALQGEHAQFDVGPESLEHTTLGALKNGSFVHLERALALHDRLDGHLVQGHVDCVGRIATLRTRGSAIDIEVEVIDRGLDLVVEKGSIAVAGVSLTVNKVSAHSFMVSVIPHSQQRTRLATVKVGERVNIEFDIIGRYVARWLVGTQSAHGVDLGFLKEHGFA